MVKAKPTERLAILWSFDLYGNYAPESQMVGSVLAHMGHLERNGGVYWDLIFKVNRETLRQFEFPMSGYLYSSFSGTAEYRARIIDICVGPPRKHKECIPVWRLGYESEDNLWILMDQIDSLLPVRELNEFSFFDDGRPVESPPPGNYLKIRDPLY